MAQFQIRLLFFFFFFFFSTKKMLIFFQISPQVKWSCSNFRISMTRSNDVQIFSVHKILTDGGL